MTCVEANTLNPGRGVTSFMNHDFIEPSNLASGTARQRMAHEALASLGILGDLSQYSPVLCGTIPIDLDIPGSDLDIICRAADLDAFEANVRRLYLAMANFRSRRSVRNGLPSAVVSFGYTGFDIELFAQDRPVTAQNAYRHMLVEARLLEIGGPAAREKIRALKQTGLKTEPAFAAYFNLSGDPYETLLSLAELPIISLCEQVALHRRGGPTEPDR